MKDSFDMFAKPERGRFGDSERITGNDSVRSDLVDLTLELRMDKPEKQAIAVTDPAKPGSKWIWLPRSQIEYTKKGQGVVDVALPGWLAKDKGLT